MGEVVAEHVLFNSSGMVGRPQPLRVTVVAGQPLFRLNPGAQVRVECFTYTEALYEKHGLLLAKSASDTRDWGSVSAGYISAKLSGTAVDTPAPVSTEQAPVVSVPVDAPEASVEDEPDPTDTGDTDTGDELSEDEADS